MQMRRTLALSVLALLVVAGNAFALGEARVQGKITDAATHKPIPNVVITVDATTGHSVHNEFKADKDGVYRFLILDGTLMYKFTYKAPGYNNVEQTMKLALGDINTKDVTMAPAGSNAPAGTAAAPTAAKANPAVAAYNEGAELANANKIPEAIAKMEEAVAAKPDLTAGYQGLAKLYVRNKN